MNSNFYFTKNIKECFPYREGILFRGSFLILFIFFGLNAQTQIIDAKKDVLPFYAETKQVNQFFRRFNNEEGVDGSRYYNNDSLFRNSRTRWRYLKILFDNESSNIANNLKNDFIDDVTNKSDPLFLDFHGGNWFAQVAATFYWQGKEEKAILYLQLQEEKVGSKWIISRINFNAFNKLFSKDTTGSKYFLHPLSHELDFMNLHRVFQNNKENIESYTSREYQIDQLTLFLYEVKQGNIQFKTINGVKFHFFQLPNWYFELSDFNRTGNNTGWLISNLIKVNEEEKKILLQYIYNQKE